MSPFKAFSKLPKDRYTITIGTFDGVHRGHQKLIEHLKETARTRGTKSLVITFFPHPAEVLRGKDTIQLLTTNHERTFSLKSQGVDRVVTMPFTLALSKLTAIEFLSALAKSFKLDSFVVGYDFTLGHNREGDFARIEEIGRELGFTTIDGTALEVGGKPVSSTTIRQLIQSGDVSSAGDLLGRYYALSGPVVSGDGRGSKLGFPTANISYPPQKVIPQLGVYATWVTIGKHVLPAVTNIGLRPTFDDQIPHPRLEAFILEDIGDIYGKELAVHFVSHLRQEQKFASVDALIAQIDQDKLKAMEVLRHAQKP